MTKLIRSTWLSLLGLLVVLAGCSNPAEEAAVAADMALQSALEQVKLVGDPWEGFKLLDSLETEALASKKLCQLGSCEKVPTKDASTKERVRLLGLAVENGQVEALSFLYANGFGTADEYARLRRDAVPKLFAYADRASGTAEDRPLLMMAGRLVADGNEVMLDTSRAVGYFARAWAAGEAKAANAAAVLFLRINDLRNAYLWSLRCTGECSRNSGVELERLQADLSPEAAKQVQSVAAKPSVVELNTSGG